MGGLFLFLGLFLQVEREFLRGSIDLFVVTIAILNGKMMSEIIQNRWFKLSFEEKKRLGSLDRWFESFQQLGQICVLLANGFFNFLKSFQIQSERTSKEKKWVHPELKEEINEKVISQSNLTDSNKIRNQELTQNEETS
tara:strand:+ start:337 stop:753 length:417 start_codon:yes stop_codon:yes gene_type:complete